MKYKLHYTILIVIVLFHVCVCFASDDDMYAAIKDSVETIAEAHGNPPFTLILSNINDVNAHGQEIIKISALEQNIAAQEKRLTQINTCLVALHEDCYRLSKDLLAKKEELGDLAQDIEKALEHLQTLIRDETWSK